MENLTGDIRPASTVLAKRELRAARGSGITATMANAHSQLKLFGPASDGEGKIKNMSLRICSFFLYLSFLYPGFYINCIPLCIHMD